MIRKKHTIVLEDTSPSELARFRQIVLGIWRQQIEDDKNALAIDNFINEHYEKASVAKEKHTTTWLGEVVLISDLHDSNNKNNPKQNIFKSFKGDLSIVENLIIDSSVNVNGHFYNKDGTFEGKVNIVTNKGNVNDVYVCDGEGNEKNTFVNAIKLDITHENFCYIAGVINAEDSSTFESAAATTQATFNAVKFEKGDKLSIEEQGKLAKKLLQISGEGAYSTVPIGEKIPLEDTKNNDSFKNARKGLIHVLQEKKDYSEGAVLWDGIDFADKGISHNKAKVDGGISITKELWMKLVNNSDYKADKDNIFRLNRGNKEKDKTKEEALATIPFEEKKNTSPNYSYNIFDFGQKKNSIWDTPADSKGIKNVDYYETVGTGKFNKGRTLNQATTVVGRHIFWKPYKDHLSNKGYYWKGMMNHKL